MAIESKKNRSGHACKTQIHQRLQRYSRAHAQPATRPSWIYIMARARAIDRVSMIERASKAASAWSADTRKDGVWRGNLGGTDIAFAGVRT